MNPSNHVRVLHLVGGRRFQGGTASVVRDLVTATPAGVPNWIWVHRDCSEEVGLRFVRRGSSRIVSASIAGDFFGAIRDLPALLRTIKELQIAVLHAHTRLGIFAGWLAHQFSGAPLIIHLHFLAGHPSLYCLLIRTASATVIYNSDRTCQHFGGDLQVDNVIKPTLNWPTTELRESSTPRIVTASAIVPNKNVDVIIEACSALQDTEGPLSLFIYGLLPESIAPASQRKVIHKYGHLKFVTFVEWTRNWGDLLSTGDIFVHAGASESFGLTILEAFARGLKLVVPRPSFLQGLAPKIANTGIYYVSDVCVQNLASAIRTAMDDPVQTLHLRELRREIAPQFSKELAAQRVSSIYRSVV
jgi:glycosyltransferase involved in cell wall biosynthesis